MPTRTKKSQAQKKPASTRLAGLQIEPDRRTGQVKHDQEDFRFG